MRWGWYKLPKSGAPYFGPLPEGAEEITDREVVDAVITADGPVEVDAELVLSGTIDEIADHAEGYPIDVVRRLIETEHAGRNRSTLLDKLERLAKAKEEIPPAG